MLFNESRPAMIRESSDSDAPRGTRAPEKQTQHRSNQQEHPVALTSEPGVPDLIPIRMLNEYSYCSRLGYLEWVDGEWADDLETMQGAFGHRRVDRPVQRSAAVSSSIHDVVRCKTRSSCSDSRLACVSNRVSCLSGHSNVVIFVSILPVSRTRVFSLVRPKGGDVGE